MKAVAPANPVSGYDRRRRNALPKTITHMIYYAPFLTTGIFAAAALVWAARENGVADLFKAILLTLAVGGALALALLASGCKAHQVTRPDMPATGGRVPQWVIAGAMFKHFDGCGGDACWHRN